jgi:DNA-directed RNA polymerase subunit K/omega
MMKHKTNLTTQDFSALNKPTGNIYEAVTIIAKRARQIAARSKEELDNKLVDFITDETEELQEEEVAAKQEQAEITRLYERMPKPTNIAIDEFLGDRLMHRYPEEEDNTIV